MRDPPAEENGITKLRARVMVRVQEPVFRDFGPTLPAVHLSRDPEIGDLNAHALSEWMIEKERRKSGRPGVRHS